MSTAPSSETSRAQLAAVGLALALATLTFLFPLALAVLGATAMLAFAVGAKSLHFAHGLDPGSFSAGFYLAILLLLGAGGWQVLRSSQAWRARRKIAPAAADEGEPKALASAKLGGLPTSLSQRPWMLLGVALLLVDMSLVRWEIRGRLNSPDGLLAAAILASMVWATVFIAVMSVRLTGLLWRTLIRSSRRSPYTAGLVTAFGLAISLASVLAQRSYSGETTGTAFEQSVITSIREAPSSSSSMEQIRLALVEYADPKQSNDDAQPLVKEPLPAAQPQPVPAAEPLEPDIAAATAAAAALAAPVAEMPAAAPAAPQPATSGIAPLAPPAATAAAAGPTAAADLPFIDLSFGPPAADCVDRLTTQRTDGDPIQFHMRRIMTRFGISEHDARALVIDTLVSVCTQKADDRGDLSRYFSRSVTNRALNFATRHLNGSRVCPIELVPVVDYPDESENWRFGEETEQRAQRAYCLLSEFDQAIIEARVVNGRTFGQIAEMSGLSESGAAKAFDRALRRLKEKFQKN